MMLSVQTLKEWAHQHSNMLMNLKALEEKKKENASIKDLY